MKPRFEISKKVVLEQFEKVKNISDIVSYSSKTNPLVTSVLEENVDCLFSVHSVNELKNIGDKSQVIFLAQGWDEQEINSLIELGIKFFVVDNVCDLDVLKRVMVEKSEVINLLLRLKLKENTLQTEKHFVFGFDSDFINGEILKLKEEDWVQCVGIHFHRKTQNMAEWNLRREIEEVLDKNVLEDVDYIVIGGGLPSVYKNTNVEVIEGIIKKIKEFREWINSFGCKMIIEPGRFIAAPSGKLISYVKAVYGKNIILDVSVYNSDMDSLIVPVKLLIEGEFEKDQGQSYAIKGITPCSLDLFRYKVYLSEKKVGDEIVFLNAGAYNFSTDFCDLDKIETKIVDDFE